MSDTIESVTSRLNRVQQRIADAARAAGRDIDEIRLIAVSKTRPAEDLIAAQAAGQTRFGESYLQEALVKIAALQAYTLEWHFIGPIQSNKTRRIAESFDWVHSVSRIDIAQRLDRQRPPALPPLNVCLQVNVSGEAAKSGCTPEQLPQLAAAVSELEHLQLRGLMAVPAASGLQSEQCQAFRQLRELYIQLKNDYPSMDSLSMGMSNDLEAAIQEGATHLRIGSAIFGPRAARANA